MDVDIDKNIYKNGYLQQQKVHYYIIKANKITNNIMKNRKVII